MATYATDLTVLNACDAVSGWSELPSPHAAGAAPSADTENYFHNAISISQATGQAVDDGAGIQFDNGADLTWTATSNWVIMMWSYYAAPTNLKTWANGGGRIGIGSADNNAKFFNAMGSNFGKYPYGGWQCTAIDPEFATADFTLGTPGAGYANFAFLANVTAKITKGSPIAVDVLRYGRGEFQVTGTAALFSGMATANDDATTGRWGLFQSEGGSNYLWKGLMSLGLTGTTVTMTDSNISIVLEDTPRILAGFNKIEINNAGSSVTWTTVNISGRELSITGSAPISSGDFEVIDNATVDKTTCTFTDLGTFGYLSNSDMTACIYRRCKLVTSGGASLTSCSFDSSIDASAITVATLVDLIDCDFTKGATGHAVELTGAAGSYTWDCIATDYDTGTADDGVEVTGGSITGDETIHITATTGTFNISVNSGKTVPSVSSAGAIVNVTAGQATYTQTVIDKDTSSAIEGVAITVTPSDGTGPFPYQDSVTITRATTTATVAHTAHGMKTGHKVKILGANENEFNRIKTITVTGVNAYTYTVTAGAGDATGTITSTAIIIDGLTNASGQIADTRGYGGTNQPITGTAKKGSGAPVYKSTPITGTIDSANGLSITTAMTKD